MLLKNELITSRFRIADKVQLDIHCSVASYLSKCPFVIAMKNIHTGVENNENIIEFNNPKDNNNINTTYYIFIVTPPIVD